MSTSPRGSATARTTSSVTSVSTFEAFFGHDTQMNPACYRRSRRTGSRRSSTARSNTNRCAAGISPRTRDRIRTPSGSSPSQERYSAGSLITTTSSNGSNPSFFRSGVFEYPAIALSFSLVCDLLTTDQLFRRKRFNLNHCSRSFQKRLCFIASICSSSTLILSRSAKYASSSCLRRTSWSSVPPVRCTWRKRDARLPAWRRLAAPEDEMARINSGARLWEVPSGRDSSKDQPDDTHQGAPSLSATSGR
jgi:hypothetical protein